MTMNSSFFELGCDLVLGRRGLDNKNDTTASTPIQARSELGSGLKGANEVWLLIDRLFAYMTEDQDRNSQAFLHLNQQIV